MTLVAVQGLWMQPPPQVELGPPTLASSAIDAAAEKVAWIGPVWNKDRATKNITKVGFLPGAITSAGGSTMRISLQNVDTATGAPQRPDGTQDQTVDFLASAPTASTWYQTAALSATRSVAYGEMLAVVLEFQSFAGADIFNVQNLGIAAVSSIGNTAFTRFISSWAVVFEAPNIILEFDDGTFGTLQGGFPVASTTTTTVSSSSTPDEVALQFTVPFACKVDGAWVNFNVSSPGRNFDVVLYEGTTALATASIDAEYMATSNGGRVVYALFAEQTLAAGVTYYLAVKPTTVDNGVVYSFTVANANHFQAHAGGTSWQYATRVDAGAWSATTTRRVYGGIVLSAVHDGAGAGGGGGGASINRRGIGIR